MTELTAQAERTRPRLRERGVAHVAGIVVALAVYGLLRTIVEGSRADAVQNARSVMEFEQWLRVDWERAAQDWVLERPGWVRFWNQVYQWLYWATVGSILILLWFRDRRRYALLLGTLLVSAGIGLVIWTVFPVSPPRFVGYVDTLALTGDRLMDERVGWVNRYAAIPSFHVAWPAVAGFVVAMGSRSAWQWTLASTPTVLLAFAVVFTGNHFVVDGIVGLAVVAVSLLIATRSQALRRMLGGPDIDP